MLLYLLSAENVILLSQSSRDISSLSRLREVKRKAKMTITPQIMVKADKMLILIECFWFFA
jgi:hypothetical protein